MIAYVCKYTPIEIIEAFNEEPFLIEPSFSSFNKADELLHPNMCSYSKAVLEEILLNNIEEVVLTTCCDSVKRLYDVLKTQPQIKFIHIIDVPRKINPLSTKIFKNQLKDFIYAYENYSGKKFDIDILKEKIKSTNLNTGKYIKPGNINLCLSGARYKNSIIDIIENSGGTIKNNTTCNTHTRVFNVENHPDSLLLKYAEDILNFYPCMRMTDVNKRYSLLNDIEKSCDGIIYHTIKFCDFYSYDYANLRKITNIPILKIETDYSDQSEKQAQTRIEAFIESLNSRTVPDNSPNISAEIDKTNSINLRTVPNNFSIGIDSGSTSTNVVIMDENKQILSYSVVRTGAKSKDSAKKAIVEALKKAKLKKDQISIIISTGYGRENIPFGDMSVTEITCHGKGAHFINNKIKTIIDIGGQDSKIISINDKGEVVDFIMNDKCAAGTGRFLEMMSRTLEIPIEDMGPESLKSKKDVSITNMCTVFAESEVISLIAENVETADIIQGLNNSVSKKVISLLNKVGGQEQYMMSGGVAKNIGVVKSIEKQLGSNIIIPKEPEIIGAIGAALIGLEKL